MEIVLSKRDGLQDRLDAKASKLLEVGSQLTAVRERLEQRSEHSDASHLVHESLISYSVSGFVDGVAAW